MTNPTTTTTSGEKDGKKGKKGKGNSKANGTKTKNHALAFPDAEKDSIEAELLNLNPKKSKAVLEDIKPTLDNVNLNDNLRSFVLSPSTSSIPTVLALHKTLTRWYKSPDRVKGLLRLQNRTMHRLSILTKALDALAVKNSLVEAAMNSRMYLWELIAGIVDELTTPENPTWDPVPTSKSLEVVHEELDEFIEHTDHLPEVLSFTEVNKAVLLLDIEADLQDTLTIAQSRGGACLSPVPAIVVRLNEIRQQRSEDLVVEDKAWAHWTRFDVDWSRPIPGVTVDGAPLFAGRIQDGIVWLMPIDADDENIRENVVNLYDVNSRSLMDVAALIYGTIPTAASSPSTKVQGKSSSKDSRAPRPPRDTGKSKSSKGTGPGPSAPAVPPPPQDIGSEVASVTGVAFYPFLGVSMSKNEGQASALDMSLAVASAMAALSQSRLSFGSISTDAILARGPEVKLIPKLAPDGNASKDIQAWGLFTVNFIKPGTSPDTSLDPLLLQAIAGHAGDDFDPILRVLTAAQTLEAREDGMVAALETAGFKQSAAVAKASGKSLEEALKQLEEDRANKAAQGGKGSGNDAKASTSKDKGKKSKGRSSRSKSKGGGSSRRKSKSRPSVLPKGSEPKDTGKGKGKDKGKDKGPSTPAAPGPRRLGVLAFLDSVEKAVTGTLDPEARHPILGTWKPKNATEALTLLTPRRAVYRSRKNHVVNYGDADRNPGDKVTETEGLQWLSEQNFESVLLARSDGKYAVLVAVEQNNAPVLRWLLAGGELSDPESTPVNPNMGDVPTSTVPLTTAAAIGSLDCVGALLDAGASQKVNDAGGWYPLHAAVTFARDDCVELLLKFGADPRRATELPDGTQGETPLEMAQFAHNSSQRVLDLLREYGATRAMDETGQTHYPDWVGYYSDDDYSNDDGGYVSP